MLSEFTIGKYRFDFSSRTLEINRIKQVLSPREAELLQMLCTHMNKLVKREDILRRLWKEVNYFKGRSLDVYVTHLRKYLQADNSVTLINLHKAGYILEVKQAA
jgi:two-component system OmpR family response regulator